MTKQFKKQRRSFLQGAAIGGAATAMPMSVSAALDKIQQAEFPLPDFESAAGDTVSIKTAEGIVSKAVIEEVQEIPFDSDEYQRPGYVRPCAKVVRFRVADADQFSNQVHQVKHSKLGKMELLLSAVPDADGIIGLEAVFN